MTRVKLFLILAFTLITAGFANAQVKELIQAGDNAAEEQFNNAAALEKFQAADKASPNNWEVYWRLSRTYVDIADHMPASTDAQKQAQQQKYQMGLDYADKAVQMAPDKSVTYLRRAIANGKIALFKGVFSVIGIVNKVKDDCEKSIKLGNGGNYVQAVAHYVLGKTHFKVCEKAYLVRLPLGLGWGDIDIAEKEVRKAIELYPNFRMFYLDMAKIYVEQDEYQKAKDAISKLEKSPKANQDDDRYLAEARTLGQQIKNK